MIFHSATYSNPDSTAAIASFDTSVNVLLSESDTSAEWADMLSQLVPEPFAAPAATKADVNVEMRRRIGLAGGNGDETASNAAIRDYLVMKNLNNILYGGPALTAQEKAEWDRQFDMADDIIPIVMAAKTLKQMDPIPPRGNVDPPGYPDNSWWPPVPA